MHTAYGGDSFDVESAGLEPGELNPDVVEVLEEEGIDISGKVTRSVFEFYREGRTYEHVITVCSKEAEEKCPIFGGPTLRHNRPFEDPSSIRAADVDRLSEIRTIRDQIRARVKGFVETENMDNADSVFEMKKS